MNGILKSWRVWLVGLVCCVAEAIESQYSRINSIEKEESEKSSFEKELEQYIEESKEYLTKEYKEHEELMLDKIKDSKLIAAYLEKGSYSDVLLKYNKNVKELQNEINNCDRSIARYVSEIKTRSQSWLGYGLFLPKRIV